MRLMFDADKVKEVVATSGPGSVPDYMLVRLLRSIFYRRQVTLDDFSRCYEAYGQRLDWAPDEIRIRNNNDRKALTFANKLTIFLFNRILFNVMGLNIEAIEVVTRDPKTGVQTVYSSDCDLGD